jgi:hypothetical protein
VAIVGTCPVGDQSGPSHTPVVIHAVKGMGPRLWPCLEGMGGSLVDVYGPDDAMYFVPANAVATLRAATGLVKSVEVAPTGPATTQTPAQDAGSLYNVARAIGAPTTGVSVSPVKVSTSR